MTSLIADPKQEFAAAFVKALAEMPDVHKGKKAEIETKSGGTFSYAYADLASIIGLVRPVLAKHGLVAAQATDTLQPGTVSVTTRIYHTGGHTETFGTLTIVAGEDARRAGSAVTYARRYSLCAALGIAPDEDTDGAGLPQQPKKTEQPKDTTKGSVTNAQHARLKILADNLTEGSGQDWRVNSRNTIKDKYGRHSHADLSETEADEQIKYLEAQLEAQGLPF